MPNAYLRDGDREMRRAAGVVCVILGLTTAPAVAQEVKLLEKYNDWSVYTADGDGKVCFAVSQPKSSTPKNVRRGPIYFYISSYPKDKVTSEISVKMGYPFAPGGKVAVNIGSTKFELFTKDEGAFIEKTEDEAKLVDAMKAGSAMTVKGRSARGTNTTDNYSLSGATAALERIAKECAEQG
jgi:invasion protein IalB